MSREMNAKITPPCKAGEDQSNWERYMERLLFDVIAATKPT